MRHLLIDHSYHRGTSSSRWFIDFVRNHSTTLDIAWDEEWIGGPSVLVEDVLARGYDRIFVFQLEKLAALLAQRVPERLLFIPMYDSSYQLKDKWWRSLGRTRILNFSWALHTRLRKLGLQSLHAQYFPDPDLFQVVSDFSNLKGFFWLRRPNLAWPTIKHLASNASWSTFYLHYAPDPDPDDPPPVCPPSDDIADFNMSISKWEEDNSSYHRIAKRANMFFASRRREGIGMSFLEAMARGQCVIAPDAPTFCEYITNNVSGLLYDPDALKPLDLSCAAKIGAAARHRVERGYRRWVKDLRERLPEFIFNERSTIVVRGPDHGSWEVNFADSLNATEDASGSLGSATRESVISKKGYKSVRPLVTVAMVVRNAAATFAETFRSIEQQTYPDIEIIVVDGASSDGTLNLIRERQSRISTWLSEPDAGPYDGMNKAVRLAKGRWTLFMNAGDLFYTRDAVERALDGVPAAAHFVIGHHIYRTVEGIEELHKANDFEETWQALISGNWNFQFLSRVPGHQATFTRTDTLSSEGGYHFGKYPCAADHEFMFRMRAKGASFHHCDEIIATYRGGGFSWIRQKDTLRDWCRIARWYGPPGAANKLYISPVNRIIRRSRNLCSGLGNLFLRQQRITEPSESTLATDGDPGAT